MLDNHNQSNFYPLFPKSPFHISKRCLSNFWNKISGDFIVAHDQCAQPELQRPSEDSVDSEQDGDDDNDDDDVDEFE